MTNHLVEIDGDRASDRVTVHRTPSPQDPADRNVLVVVIRYVDRYARGRAWLAPYRSADRFLWSERHDMVDAEAMTAAAKG